MSDFSKSQNDASIGMVDLVNATKGQALNTGELVKAFNTLSGALSNTTIKAVGTPAAGQIAQWVSSGDLAGYTMSGDATISSSGAITITKLGGQTVSLAGSLTTGGSFTTSGAYAITLTATGSTNITLPTSGTLVGNTGTPTSGQVALWSSASILGGYTVSGDGTLSSSGVLTVTKTNNVAFASSATTDTTNAANISSGFLPAARSGFWTILTSGNTLSNVNTAQNIFPTGQGSIALSSSTTYEFESVFTISRAAGTTSHTVAVLFSTTQTLTSINFFILSSNDNLAPGWWVPAYYSATSISGVTVTPANAAASELYNIVMRGIIVTGANAPTIAPQIKYSAAPGGAPTVLTGSYFKITPLGAGSTTTVGTGWS